MTNDETDEGVAELTTAETEASSAVEPASDSLAVEFPPTEDTLDFADNNSNNEYSKFSELSDKTTSFIAELSDLNDGGSAEKRPLSSEDTTAAADDPNPDFSPVAKKFKSESSSLLETASDEIPRMSELSKSNDTPDDPVWMQEMKEWLVHKGPRVTPVYANFTIRSLRRLAQGQGIRSKAFSGNTFYADHKVDWETADLDQVQQDARDFCHKHGVSSQNATIYLLSPMDKLKMFRGYCDAQQREESTENTGATVEL